MQGEYQSSATTICGRPGSMEKAYCSQTNEVRYINGLDQFVSKSDENGDKDRRTRKPLERETKPVVNTYTAAKTKTGTLTAATS